MSENKNNGIPVEAGTLAVKNKKFKKYDFIAFGVCLILALFIWIYASNVKKSDEAFIEELNAEFAQTQVD